MATPTVYAFPAAITPNSNGFEYTANDAVMRSPLSGFVQTSGRGQGDYWRYRGVFHNLTTVNANLLRAFLVRLGGRQHRFTIHDHDHTQQGLLAGTPLVDGASQTGTTLNTKGWTPGTTIKAGDYCAFLNGNGRQELKMVMADVTADTAGLMALEVRPSIHASPADEASLDVTAPVGTFMLAGPVRWGKEPGDMVSLTLEAVEDVT